MPLEQKLQLKLSQKLVMTPTLQQAIKLLQLSRLELEQALSQEIETNPLLELSEDAPVDETGAPAPSDGEGEDGGETRAQEEGEPPVDAGDPAAFAEVELEALFANYLHDAPTVAATWESDEESGYENSPAPEASMFDALCEQLRFLDLPEATRRAAEFLIGNLEPDGYLRADLSELASQLGVDGARLEAALTVVQSLEPAGIGARSIQECFLLQLERFEPEGAEADVLTLARRVVVDGFDDLLHQRWERIEDRLGVGRDDIRGVLDVVRRLELHPGTRLGPNQNAPIEPDVTVTRVDGRWSVAQSDDGLPKLRLSSRYVRLLQSRTLDGQATGFVRERMRAALWFLRSVEQRQNTILKVAQAIVRRQEGFLDRGISHLRPLVLRDIADDIGMHESTVSRVVANKYIATPRGIFPLKFFFHSAISHAVQGDISSVVVKERIKQLVENEDPSRPLSDARIARQLNRVGIRIARRTVAKYREELNLPSSEQRRRALR
jgi:RNA polymerase sigma-54 factor